MSFSVLKTPHKMCLGRDSVYLDSYWEKLGTEWSTFVGISIVKYDWWIHFIGNIWNVLLSLRSLRGTNMARSRQILENLLNFSVFMVIFLCVSWVTPQCLRGTEQIRCFQSGSWRLVKHLGPLLVTGISGQQLKFKSSNLFSV